VSYLRRFGQFRWNFIVGDNVPLAVGAGAAVALTALLVHVGVNAWWLLPTSILVLLAASVAVTADPDNPVSSLRRSLDAATMKRAAARSIESRDERDANTRAPETLGADTKAARFVGEPSMRDVERLAD